jgi:hypothetical protein
MTIRPSAPSRLAFAALGLATLVALPAGPPDARGQIADPKCADRVNSLGRKVSAQQLKENRRCVKAEGKQTLATTVAACLTADLQGRVQKKKDMVSGQFTPDHRCTGLEGTDLVTDAATINAAHQDQTVSLLRDVFGQDLDAGQILPGDAERKCQDRITQRAGRLFDAWVREFRRCKKTAMDAGASTATAVVSACLSGASVNGTGSALADTKGKIGLRGSQLAQSVQDECVGQGLDPGVMAPGACAIGGTQGDFTQCMQDLGECRACEALKAADALGTADCDLVDNGTADGSCPPLSSPCEALNAAECLLPYPSSFFQVPDPTTATGLRLNLPAEGLPTVNGTPLVPTPYNQLDGYSPMVQVHMHFPQGVDLVLSDAARLLAPGCCGQPAGPPWIDTRTHDERSLDADSPSVLMRASTGERVLHYLEIDGRATGAQIPARQAVFLRPAKSLEPGERYIVAMRNLKAPGGAAVVAEAPFAALRDGTPNPLIEGRRAKMESDVFAPLVANGIDRSELVLAFDFTVQSEDQLTRQMLSMRDQAFAWLATVEATPGLVTFTVDSSVDHNCADPGQVVWREVSGTFQSPLFLDGQPVQTGPQFLNVDADDLPVQNGFMNAPYDIAIPCSVFDGGVTSRPIVLGHGIFGTGQGMVQFVPDLKAQFADWTYIAGGTDWIGLSSRRDTSSDVNWIGSHIIGLINNQFNNFPAFPDRLRQGMLNTLVLGKMMKRGLFNRHAAFESAPGVGVFPGPAEDMYYYGISLGGIMGTWFAALTPDVERFGLDVPAINFSCLLQRSTQFATFDFAIDLIGVNDPIRKALFIHLAHELWVSAEPAGFARHITSDPLPGSGGPKRILYHPSWLDKQVSNQCSEVAARTLELPNLVGSLVRGLEDIPDLPGPLDSAHVLWDFGAFDLFDPAHAPHIPPLSNIIPTSVCDPHNGPRAIPAAVQQLIAFLQPGGQISNFCNGLCDAAEPLEIAGGGTCGPDSPAPLQGMLCVDDAECGGGTCEATVCDPLSP